VTFEDTLRAIVREEVRAVVREELRALAEARAAPAAAPGYLTVEQVAERLGVKPPTVRAWISKGELEAGRAGHRLVVTHQALANFVTAAGHRRATHTTLAPEAQLSTLVERLGRTSKPKR
jgi:excisionase family DNA binding protein